MSDPKRCYACKQFLSRDRFSKNASKKDGLSDSCKPCAYELQKKIKLDPERWAARMLRQLNWQKKNPEKKCEQIKKWQRKNRDKVNEHAARGRQKHPEKHAAREITRAAIKRGQIIKLPCEKCGHDKAQAHHDDYSKPLEVRWLCQKHHTEHHNRLREEAGIKHP